MNIPSVSLIITTYNWPEALELSLLGMSRQTMMPDEVIIADDGSRPDTADLINEMRKAFPTSIVHVWHEDDGFRLAAIRNKAIAAAKGDYIIQIDGDIITDKHFVEDHIAFSKEGCFTAGSRVSTDANLCRNLIKEKRIDISLFERGIGNRLNRIRCKTLTNYFRFRYRKNKPYDIRGCNMAFWKKDLLAVNGYNEDIAGWGAEDSEIAARLISSGVKRQFLKFGAVIYHLYHKQNSRDQKDSNYAILRETVKNKTTYCKNGVDKYL